MERSTLYKHLIIILILLACTVALPNKSSARLLANEFEAWVVDAQTNKPVEGVILIARWGRYSQNLHGGFYEGNLKTLEAVSGSSGKLSLPKWGKILVTDFIKATEPDLIFYKPGYEIRTLQNSFDYSPRKHDMRSEWHEKKIKLKRSNNTNEQLVKDIKLLNDLVVDRHGYKENCEWENMPNLILFMIKEKKHFKKNGLAWPGSIADRIWHRNDKYVSMGCKSSRKFIRDLYANSKSN